MWCGNSGINGVPLALAATNLDLPAGAAAGKFREDLLDRLAFDVMTLPPLRARAGDVGMLSEHFGRAMAKDLGWAAFPGFLASARAALEAYAWPGNVRELKNVVERAVAFCNNPAAPIDSVIFDPFASPYRPAPAPTAVSPRNDGDSAPIVSAKSLPTDFKSAVAAFESDLLTRALNDARHNQRVAAKRLGMNYHQFRNTLRKHGLLPARAEASG